jgi:uncharacterized membrane protein YecN with MAPEG domain
MILGRSLDSPLETSGTFALIGATYVVLPPLNGMEETSARLSLAVGWLVVAMLPYIAVCLTITSVRYFEGAHNLLLGGESERLKIHCRVMQNTLEQFVWFAFCVMALAAHLSPSQARLVPIVCTSFAVARFVYWWGYLRSDTLGRAPGVQLTLSVNILVLALALALGATRLGIF